jgi:CRP-like cAMP-binding protein
MERKCYNEASKCLNVDNMLARCVLFSGVKPEEIRGLMTCMDGQVLHYSKGEYLLRAGDKIDSACILLTGGVIAEQVDYWGNRDILQEIRPGELFAVNYAINEGEVVPSNVVAIEDSCVLMIEADRLVKVCDRGCACHNRVKDNLILMLSTRNRALTQKLRHLSKRSTREKLISYLTEASINAGKKEFDIRLDRQQLADYLAVDRSAMSSELSKMKNEGMLDYKKNHFTLYVRAEE